LFLVDLEDFMPDKRPQKEEPKKSEKEITGNQGSR
jgi:hypothetical protein